MATKYYTSWKTYVDGNTPYRVRYWISVAISSTDTTTTATISGGAEYFKPHTGTVLTNIDLKMKIQGTGQSQKTGTKTVSMLDEDAHNITIISSYTWSWARGTSSATKTLTVTSTVTTSLTKDTTITVPALPSYAISYDVNGGSGSIASQTKYYGKTLTITNSKPTRSGCTFIGWSTTQSNPDAGSVDYASGSSYSANSAATLYAVWEITYVPPSISNVSIERCDSNGNADDEGKYAMVSFDWEVNTNKYSNNAISAISVTVGSKSATPSPAPSGTNGHVSAKVGDGTFDIDTEYVAAITVTDSVGAQTTTYNGTLGTALFPIDISDTGKAIGMFQAAPPNDEGLFINGKVLARGMAGMIQMFAGSTAPDGWLICDGSAVSRTDYAILFAIIGTTYGTGNGSTTFNLPDLRGRVVIGEGTGTASDATAHAHGAIGGTETVKLTAAQSGVPAHSHGNTFKLKVASPSNTGTLSTSQIQYGRPDGTNYENANAITGGVSQNTAAGASSAHNNMQPFIAMNYIICTGKTS